MKSYPDFLISLKNLKNQHLKDNLQLLEQAGYSVKNCYLYEPYLMQELIDKCNKPLNEADKVNIKSLISSYFSLKSTGYFRAPKNVSCSITVGTVPADTANDVYISAFSQCLDNTSVL